MAGTVDGSKVGGAQAVPQDILQSPNADEKKGSDDAIKSADADPAVRKADAREAAECHARLEELGLFDPRRVGIVMRCIRFMDSARGYLKQK